MFQLRYYILVILPNVWYRCIYTYSGESQNTHMCACRHTQYLIYACMSPELHTYKYGDISSKTVVILPYFVHMHVSFQAKEVDAPKGEEQVLFRTQLPAGTTLMEHEARFILGSTAVLRNSSEIKICLNAELPTHWKQIF